LNDAGRNVNASKGKEEKTRDGQKEMNQVADWFDAHLSE